jgi:hypothetical protein
MKRPHPRKLRDRRSGQSPYQRHSKAPYQYSGAYNEWRGRYKRAAAKTAVAGRGR